jgi:hypothetical protein
LIFTSHSILSGCAKASAPETSGNSEPPLVHADSEEIRALARSGASGARFALDRRRIIDLQITGAEDFDGGGFALTGQVAGIENSSVTFSIYGRALVGQIINGASGEQFEIRPVAEGVHAVRRLGEPPEEECPALPAPESPEESQLRREQEADPSQFGVLATPTIDVLAAYTPKARAAQGGRDAIRALIQMGVADANRAYIDSGVDLKVHLAGTMEVSQNETGNFSADLDALQAVRDGRWDEVHAERRRLGADQVSLIGSYANNSRVNGIGYIGGSKSWTFTVTKAGAFNQFTFAHELGHNIGLDHADGFENKTGGFRTIMAYGEKKRVRRFSNPLLDYGGWRTGTDRKNSARILNANGARIAGLLTPGS